MNRLITSNIENIQNLCRTYHVKKLWAFGSVCNDKFNHKSDIDLLVSFTVLDYADYADNYFLLCEKLETLFKRSVDLITVNSLSNPYFVRSVEKTKSVLYE